MSSAEAMTARASQRYEEPLRELNLHHDFRRWYLREMIAQLEGGAARPWSDRA